MEDILDKMCKQGDPLVAAVECYGRQLQNPNHCYPKMSKRSSLSFLEMTLKDRGPFLARARAQETRECTEENNLMTVKLFEIQF